MGLKTLYKKFCYRVEEGSLITIFLTIGFGIVIGIALHRFAGYPKEIGDWISWLIVWASAGGWLKIHYQLRPNMDISFDINCEDLPPKTQVWYNLDEKGTLYIYAVINFCNRSGITNSIISETYLISNDNQEFIPLKRVKPPYGLLSKYQEVVCPDVYQPYTAKRYAITLSLNKESVLEMLKDTDKYWIKFIFSPIKGEDITLTTEMEIGEYYKNIISGLIK